jgi:DNA-binding NarL/FixJ family response regulator
MAQDQPFDLIFMDHMMPDMDGVEATKRIRALVGERFKKLPIIALTANAVSGMMEMFLENGFDDFLSKPINSSTLNAILEKWIPMEIYRVTPADKKNGPEPEKTAPEKTGAVVLPEIDGLDMAAGIAVVNGSPAQYHNLLEMFCRDARERLPKLSVKLPVAPSPEENA